MILLEIEQIVVILLFIASLVGIIVKRLRMPYTVGLVLVGLLLAFFRPVFAEIAEAIAPHGEGVLLPNLILALLVPPSFMRPPSTSNFASCAKSYPLSSPSPSPALSSPLSSSATSSLLGRG